MSADAKVWRDDRGYWHSISDFQKGEMVSSAYGLTELLIEIEHEAKQKLDWDIFEFGNGLGLRGYRARPS